MSSSKSMGSLRWKLKKISNLAKIFLSREVLIVYQMGKVGSTSIYNDLCDKYPGPVIQIHRLSFLCSSFVPRSGFRGFTMRVYTGLVRFFVSRKRKRVLVLTREPVGRNVSGYFQNFDFFQRKLKKRGEVVNADSMHRQFLYEYPHSSSLAWFDEQFHDVFGFDILSFVDQNKMAVVERGSRRDIFILMRVEDLNKERMEILSEKLSVSGLELRKDNVGSEKWYAGFYSDFLSAELPEWYKEMAAASEIYRKLYND